MIEITTRKMVDDFMSGGYKSHFKGAGVQFSEHRQYVPGDDIRHIDWKVSARTRDPLVKKYVTWGAGPRASQYLVLAAKARAILQGRYAVSIDDVRALAPPVLVHRVLPNFHAEADGLTAHAIVAGLVDAIRP